MAYKILALNTEKAHNLREKALEVIRMARDLAAAESGVESDHALIFEEPALLTLGICYERNGRFSGAVYRPVLLRTDAFLSAKLAKALGEREKRADRLFQLDEAVVAAVAKLKERGFESPYLKNFVVARINPLRFQRGASAEFDETLDTMLAGAKKFDTAKVKADQLADGRVEARAQGGLHVGEVEALDLVVDAVVVGVQRDRRRRSSAGRRGRRRARAPRRGTSARRSPCGRSRGARPRRRRRGSRCAG
jgi:ParB family transcriptional regulator, chromosome partitioning protein